MHNLNLLPLPSTGSAVLRKPIRVGEDLMLSNLEGCADPGVRGGSIYIFDGPAFRGTSFLLTGCLLSYSRCGSRQSN